MINLTQRSRRLLTIVLLGLLIALPSVAGARQTEEPTSGMAEPADPLESVDPTSWDDPRNLPDEYLQLPVCDTNRGGELTGPNVEQPPADTPFLTHQPDCVVAPPIAFDVPIDLTQRPSLRDSPELLNDSENAHSDFAATSHGGPYEWQGVVSHEQIGMVRAQLEVNNPSVPHDNSANYFTVNRIMAKNGPDTKWLEAGWAEVSWRDNNQYVYTFDTIDEQWFFYDQFDIDLNDDIYYLLDRQFCYSSGVCRYDAMVYWNNQWMLLDSVAELFGDPKYPKAEAFVEVYDNGSAPHWSIGSTDIDHLRIFDGGVWQNWTSPPIDTGVTSNGYYCKNFASSYFDFTVFVC